ncbi:LuxR C-terminal-related transcriptional regulator [Salmonella enterica]|uniref:LuxR C-terminal-related transcriptional regulator n=4 Tax=Salmonella enterica TaxID=28901 RepID=UPI000B9F9DFF|nr:LuxR C-terminal-related transcriptional regulator [Salmonella enterica]EBG6953502.1 response regulator transcription factor [Salmonella enterica subsp. enterica]EBV4613115.1 DNA-binding response regulator [Salmonella enterica subsp. enterica serovar Solt]EBC6967178.1 response regulator transcription factor [Salmonella enterica]ECB1548853.1 response regulator transcription factor [Salmonella enterica subsp. enterica serovar Solt]ECE0519032.1 DNA-binding response regulator [Salmonella enteric
MINILINDTNIYYEKGLRHGLEKFLGYQFGTPVSFSTKLTQQNIHNADIVIITLYDENSLKLLASLKHVRVIGLVHKSFKISEHIFPSCLSYVHLTMQSESLNIISKLIVNLIKTDNPPSFTKTCVKCPMILDNILSKQQQKLVEGIVAGKKMKDLANDLYINVKTAYSHKHLIMKKFKLKSDHDILNMWKFRQNNFHCICFSCN